MKQNPNIYPGLRVKTLAGEQDTDALGALRQTLPGTWGHIAGLNHGTHWSVLFANGARVVLTEDELQDEEQYQLGRPITLEECALALKHGKEALGLTIDDKWMSPFVQDIAGDPQRILDLIRECKGLNRTSQKTAGGESLMPDDQAKIADEVF